MTAISGILKYSRGLQFRSVAIYTASNFLAKGISFLLLFYFAHVLTESDFGMLNLFSNGILFLMPFVSMGILQSANAEFFRLEKKEFKNFFSTTLLMPVCAALIAMIMLCVFRNQLQQRYQFPSMFIVLLPFIVLFSFLNEHLINMVRNNCDPQKYLFVNIGRLLLEIALAVFFISVLGLGWTGRVMGILLALLFTAGYAIFYFREQGYIFGRIEKKYINAEIQYSVPIIVMQIGVFFMGSSAGYFIKHFTHDYASVGVFSVANTFGSVILVLCTALLQYVQPKIYNLLAQKRVDYNAVCRYFAFYTGAMVLGTMAVIIITPLAYSIMLKQSYMPGLSYCFLICIGYFFWSVSYLLYSFMLFHKQKRKILFASMFSVVLSFCSHYFFVRKFGDYGAALSMCAVYFTMLVVTILIVRKQIIPILRTAKTS